MSLPPAAQAGAPAPRSAPQAAASTPATAPAAPAAAPAPKPAQTASAPAASTPAPAAATPASGASPQRVASAQPVAVAPAAAPEVTATGGFAVQLGVRGSESDAEAAFEQLQKKFSDLNGMPPMIRKAEVNGKPIFRVRVGPMSRDEASSLCSKLRGQGGECYVAKN
jgi:cell division septation protein DedD